MLIFLAWFAGVISSSWAVFHAEDDPWQDLAILTFVTAIGCLINNVTAPPDQSLVPQLSVSLARRDDRGPVGSDPRSATDRRRFVARVAH